MTAIQINLFRGFQGFSLKTAFTRQSLKRYWFKALRKSYPWSAVAFLALRLPGTSTEQRSYLFARMHRAWMRQDFAAIGASVIDIQRPEYWIF
jgi:hypothetical protein